MRLDNEEVLGPDAGCEAKVLDLRKYNLPSIRAMSLVIAISLKRQTRNFC